MATASPFAYNTGGTIPGTQQVGFLSVGTPTSGFTNNPQYWNGPDEELGYVIAVPVSGNTQPTPISGVTASLGFFQTSGFSDSNFINLAQSVSNQYGTPQTFSSATDASIWLTNNGYWNSYIVSLCDTFTFIGNNAITTSNSAINDGTAGWDSSAYSLQTFTGPVSVTFQTSANGNILMGGFSYNPTATPGSTYEDTSYGFYLYNSDQIEIYENGGQVAVLNVGTVVSSSDVWKVDYDGTSVKYYYNSTLLYTSTNAVTQPLHVFFPLFTPNEGAVDICVIGTLSPIPTPTPTLTQTPTPTVTETPSETPTNTPTPTSTDLSAITTYTISGCSSSNVIVADLGPGAFFPGDTFYLDFTGATATECYTIINKINATPTDGGNPISYYPNCADCIDGTTTTYTISGCTTLNVLVANLGPGALAAGDVFNFTFTGGTPNGCYRIVEKTVGTPTDGATPLLFYVNCAACQATLVTPTPTPTGTPVSVTPTPTPTTPPILYAVSISTVYGDDIGACGGNANITAYSTNNGYPQFGDIYYTTGDGTTTLSAGWYLNGAYYSAIELDTSGALIGGPNSCG